ncbi:hypothetical protein GEMRC1_013280 [Eukaryota sp. GEM-RC1]
MSSQQELIIEASSPGAIRQSNLIDHDASSDDADVVVVSPCSSPITVQNFYILTYNIKPPRVDSSCLRSPNNLNTLNFLYSPVRSSVGINSTVLETPFNQRKRPTGKGQSSPSQSRQKELKMRFNISVLALEVMDFVNPTTKENEVCAVSWTLWKDTNDPYNEPQSMGLIWSRHVIGHNDGSKSRLPFGRLKSKFSKYLNNFASVSCEVFLLRYAIGLITRLDPDILIGWDTSRKSLGFLAKRAGELGIDFLSELARNSSSFKSDQEVFGIPSTRAPWGHLFLTLKCREDLLSTCGGFENVCFNLLKISVPKPSGDFIHDSITNIHLFSELLNILIDRSNLVISLMLKLDVISKTSELARVFGIDFFSVLSRGSQFRVESLLLRLTKLANYVLFSPSRDQVSNQRAPECIALVMEPSSGLIKNPVIVVDFQSLYPSIMIAFNYCYSTCLGISSNPHRNQFGCGGYNPDPNLISKYLLSNDEILAPNGAVYLRKSVREGILPQMLREILRTRVHIKSLIKAIKSRDDLLNSSEVKLLLNQLDSRQFALKMISNVTYGYTSAGYSGRMPCVELADSIVQTGREVLEFSINFIEENLPNCRVVYGDTDSIFVELYDANLATAFEVGNSVVSSINKLLPSPVELQMEKVLYPCLLMTKKRYSGLCFNSPSDSGFILSKGIETIRRDQCPMVSKLLQSSLELLYRTDDVMSIKNHVISTFKRILANRIHIPDFVFSKEVRPFHHYTAPPPAAVLANRLSKSKDLLSWQSGRNAAYAERVSFVIVAGNNNALLKDLVVTPSQLALDPSLRINSYYYITRQILPVLKRVFSLVNVNVDLWWNETPRVLAWDFLDCYTYSVISSKHRIESFFVSKQLRCLWRFSC